MPKYPPVRLDLVAFLKRIFLVQSICSVCLQPFMLRVSLSLPKSLMFDSGVEGYLASEASSLSNQEVFMA